MRGISPSETAKLWDSCRRTASFCFPVRLRRNWSRILRLRTAMIQAPALAGSPLWRHAGTAAARFSPAGSCGGPKCMESTPFPLLVQYFFAQHLWSSGAHLESTPDNTARSPSGRKDPTVPLLRFNHARTFTLGRQPRDLLQKAVRKPRSTAFHDRGPSRHSVGSMGLF